MSQNIKVVIDRTEVYELLGQTREALDDTKDAKVKADNFIANEGTEIKGAEQAGKRIARMYLPGAREVLSAQRALKQLNAGNVLGIIGIMNLALMLYQKLQAYYEEQRQKFQKLEDDIRKQQGYTREQFSIWYSQQQNAMASSYLRPINR